jgi:hypothetical protein
MKQFLKKLIRLPLNRKSRLNMNTVNEMITNASKKEVTVKKEDVVIRHPGSGEARSKARPIQIDTTRDVWRATVLTLFKHVADMHHTIVTIIADKYELDPTKVIDFITDDPRWTELQVHPIIHDLIGDDGRLDIPLKVEVQEKEKPKRGRPPKKVAPAAPVAVVEPPTPAPVVEPPAPVAAPAPVPAPVAAPAPVPVPAPVAVPPAKPKAVKKKINVSNKEPILME